MINSRWYVHPREVDAPGWHKYSSCYHENKNKKNVDKVLFISIMNLILIPENTICTSNIVVEYRLARARVWVRIRLVLFQWQPTNKGSDLKNNNILMARWIRYPSNAWGEVAGSIHLVLFVSWLMERMDYNGCLMICRCCWLFNIGKSFGIYNKNALLPR